MIDNIQVSTKVIDNIQVSTKVIDDIQVSTKVIDDIQVSAKDDELQTVLQEKEAQMLARARGPARACPPLCGYAYAHAGGAAAEGVGDAGSDGS